MKKLIGFALLACAGLVHAGDDGGSEYKPFVMIDTSKERDGSTLANDYINANVTLGVKTSNKVEYSIKTGLSLKDVPGSTTSDKLSNNIEGKIKKSYDLGLGFYPYVAVRLGQKFNSDTTSFTHYAVDAGAKIPTGEKWALDVGIRHRDAINYSKDYKSLRYHAMVLYDLNPSNTLGLRYTQSVSDNYEEERKGVRLHWQHNY